MKKQIIKEDAKAQLLKGAKLLYDAVSTTLGPMGENAVIQAYGEPVVTHDGVTVAKSIDIDDEEAPGARLGVEMIKVSSSKSNDNVGDGTTTSTVLAYHLINEGMVKIQAGKNSQVLRKEIKSAADGVIAELDKITKQVDTLEKCINIATISSENDEIGKIVGEMYHKLGKEAMVTVEVGAKTEIEHEIVEGYTFDKGVISPHMITDTRTQSTTVVNPVILVSSKAVGLADIGHLVEYLYNDGHDSIVVIAEDVKQDLLASSISSRGAFNVIGIKAPAFGENRIEILKDIAILTGTKVYDGKTKLTVPELGTCEKIITTHNETIITGGSDVSKRVSELEALIDTKDSEYEKEKIKRRIAQLRAKVGVIRVGGLTEMAAEETKHLVDDAVAATEASLKEGYVPGGAVTYLRLADTIKEKTDGAEVLKTALQYPFRVLMENCGHRPGLKMKELEGANPEMGFDAFTGEMVDLIDKGIIDPTMVVKQAITNSVSVAGSVLTAGVLVVNKKEKSDEEEA